MSNTLPSTSIDAYNKVTPEMLRGHYLNIIKALQSVGTCNYEKIADFVGMDRHAVGRRLKEMEGLQLIYKPGTKAPTKTGRLAYEYCLTEDGQQVKVDEGNVFKKGVKASTDYSKEIIKATKKIKPALNQQPLF